MSTTLIDELKLQMMKERIQAAYDAQHSYIAKAEDLEDELQQVLAPLSAKQKVLRILKSECSSLKEKRIAMDEEFVERKGKEQSLAKHFAESANRFRKEISNKMEWEQSKRDACRYLRLEEHRLQSLASSCQISLDRLIATCLEEEKCDKNPMRWRQIPSINRLNQAGKDAARAEAEAAKAVSALVDARRRQETYKHAQALQERVLLGEAGEHIRNLQLLKEQCSDLTKSSTNVLERIRSWQKLCVAYSKRCDGDMAVANKANQELEEFHLGVLAKDVDMAAGIEQDIDGLVEELRCAKQWRRVAQASPVFAAWLVSAWWLFFNRS